MNGGRIINSARDNADIGRNLCT